VWRKGRTLSITVRLSRSQKPFVLGNRVQWFHVEYFFDEKIFLKLLAVEFITSISAKNLHIVPNVTKNVVVDVLEQ
jgi:hypothetical protein